MNKHLALILLAAIALVAFPTSCDKKTEKPIEPPEIIPNPTDSLEDLTPLPGPHLAFPTAEGFGAYTVGGRGGKVLVVTKLADDGTVGTLRWAVDQTGARTIIFDVSGEIKLNSRLRIRNANITIAGQTAPGDGITIRDHEVTVETNQVVIRYIRFRMGDVTQIEGDAIWGRNQKDIILDHCSMSWATDETSSFYDNENFTMQWCILAESLRMSLHGKGAHGYTGIWGGRKASFIKNLIAHSDNRNPRFCGSRYSGRPNDELVDFRNNVIYNWGANSSTAGEGGSYNMVNNYYQPGPQSVNNTRIMQPWGCTGEHNQPAGTTGVFYVTGNVMRNVNGTVNTNVTNNNWNGVSGNNTVPQGRNLRSDTEFEKGTVTTLTAEEAYEQVLDKAGASHVRDAVDIRVVNEVRNRLAPARASVSGGGTRAGMIDSQEDVGGWSPLNSLPPAPRTLKGTANDDGIPDAWKIANGLPLNQNMANRYNLSNIYTNLEVYLNSLVGE